MKIILIIGFISFIAFGSQSQVRIFSLYFQNNTSVLTTLSEKTAEELNQLTIKNEVQVIEINGYSENAIDAEAQKDALKRIQFVLSTFNIDEKQISVNSFGLNHKSVPFKVDNWDRVDLYIYQGKPRKKQVNSVTEIDVNQLKKKETIESPEIAETEKEDVIPQKDAFLSSVKFFGGTKEMKSGSDADLIALKDTLVKNTSLVIEIRGHVCCEDQMKLSRQRAKTIYKYLIREGIDSKRLTYKGYSNYLPLIFPETKEAHREQNRRVDVIFKNQSNTLKK
ncbi:MAG: OmpA family protein [Flavobacteriales bacterium]|nr:OmpA family protein [Flavobacteriales bacterium]